VREEDAGESYPVVREPQLPAEHVGFNGASLEAVADGHIELDSVARERSQMEALVAMARLNPRNELEVFRAMTTAAKRPTFADKSEYRYNRGGKPVIGVSVKAARPLASYWGHIRFGWKLLRLDDEGYHIEGYAHDIQSGAMRTGEHIGQWVQQRKNRDTGKAEWQTVTDERDRRELMGKQGSILERNCILAIIPPDIIEDVISECRKTNAATANGDLKKDRASTIRAMTAALGEFGVTLDMIEKKIGHPVEQIQADELADMRAFYNSMKEGASMLDFFEPPTRGGPQNVRIDLDKVRSAEGTDPKGGDTIGRPKAAETSPAASGGKPKGSEFPLGGNKTP
jgi:hypothetical protein